MKKDKTALWFDEVTTKTNGEYTAIDEYKTCKHKNVILHNLCGNKYNVTPDRFRAGNRCPICNQKRAAMGRRMTTDTFKNKVKDILGETYTVLTEYTTCHEKVTIRHEYCDTLYEVMPRHILYDRNACPFCSFRNNQSNAEKYIDEYLTENKISFESQVLFDDLKYLSSLSFDFKINYIDGTFTLIEYDGEFHYKQFNNSEKSIKKYNDQKKRDAIKDSYCKKNNIDLLRIPYWEEKNITSILDNYLLNSNVQRLSEAEINVERTHSICE